jgi:hypothetical protein
MEKLQYLMWLPERTGRCDVKPLVIDKVAPALLACGVLGLTIDLDDEWADVASPVPTPAGEQSPDALVSIWVDCYDRRSGVEEVLRSSSVRLDGYHVLESLYTDYGTSKWSNPRDWPDGSRSPGILTVATFEQPAGSEFEEWLSFWHGQQSPMSEGVQPRCRYVRNLVVRPLEPGLPPWRGIVEEAWPSAGHVTDPMLFFCGGGDSEVMTQNINTMIEHVSQLTDLSTLRSVTMSEWIMKTVGA